MHFERVSVTCREEYRAQQEPRAFVWRGREYRIEAVVDRWYHGSEASQRVPMRYYRVATEEGSRYILRYHELFDAWSIMISP
jgi:hypothetical protein